MRTFRRFFRINSMVIKKQHWVSKFLLKAVVFLFVLTSLFYSCKKKTDTVPIDLGYNYFPFEVGKYVIYDVDSIVLDKTFPNDTFKFQIKEINESFFIDNSGRQSIRIERYKKKTSSTTWNLQDVWYSTRTTTTAEKIEENIRYVKLIFPTEKNKSWKGNAYNQLGDWDYKYSDIDKKRTLGGISFDSTTYITQYNKIDLLNVDYYAEIYAKNYGMIYKEIIVKHKDSVPGNPTGLLYKMTVNSAGP